MKRIFFLINFLFCSIYFFGQQQPASNLKKDGFTIIGNSSNQLACDTNHIATQHYVNTHSSAMGIPPLDSVLSVGNSTNDIPLISKDGFSKLYLNYYQDTAFSGNPLGINAIYNDGTSNASLILNNVANANLSYGDGSGSGGIGISGSSTTLWNTNQLTFSCPTYNFDHANSSSIAAFNASQNLIGLSTGTYPSLTELSYVKGVTSGIQTQLNTKGSGTVTNISNGYGILGGPITSTGTLRVDTATNKIATQYWVNSHKPTLSEVLNANDTINSSTNRIYSHHGNSELWMDDSVAQLSYLGIGRSGYFGSGAHWSQIYDNDKIIFTAPIYTFEYLSASSVVGVDASKNLINLNLGSGLSFNSSTNTLSASGGTGTVTSVGAGLGMNFSSITSSGNVVIDSSKVPYIGSFSSGLLKRSHNAWVFDNSTYLTGNQTITLSGDISGSGATAITTTVKSNYITDALQCTFDGQSSVVSVNSAATIDIPYNCTITGWALFEASNTPISSSVTLDTWKQTYSSYPPTVSNTIWGGSYPGLSSSTKNTATGLSISCSAGDVLVIPITAATSALKLRFVIFVTKT